MKKPASIVLSLAASCLAMACGGTSEFARSGLEEPFTVSFVPVRETKAIAAQFFPGEMAEGDGPTTSITNRQSVIVPGTLGKKIGGNASLTATAVLIRFDGIGSGYWSVPTTIPDADLKGTILWDALLNFSKGFPTGRQTMRAVAIDADGHFGPSTIVPFVAQPLVPTGAVVANLTWDTNADLDLQIITPSGRQIDAKHPVTAPKAGGSFPPGTGVMDRDSNAACVIDSIRQENLVWSDFPAESGTYLAKVDMFSACGEAAANFAFRIFIQGEPTDPVAGRLLAIDADNGSPGLAVTNFEIQP